MRYLPLIGLYNLPSGVGSLASGVRFSTQPTDIPLGGQAVENGMVYEFARISGTCCAGMLVYYTGTNQAYVCLSGTGVKPAGVALVSPTASGDWTFLLKQGRGNVHLSATFDINQASALGWAGLWAIGTSGAWKNSNVISGAQSGETTGAGFYIGQCLTAAALSQGYSYVSLL